MIQEPTRGVAQNRPRHSSHPLPHYRVDRKILIRRAKLYVWIAAYHWVGDTEVDQIVDDLLAKLD